MFSLDKFHPPPPKKRRYFRHNNSFSCDIWTSLTYQQKNGLKKHKSKPKGRNKVNLIKKKYEEKETNYD